MYKKGFIFIFSMVLLSTKYSEERSKRRRRKRAYHSSPSNVLTSQKVTFCAGCVPKNVRIDQLANRRTLNPPKIMVRSLTWAFYVERYLQPLFQGLDVDRLLQRGSRNGLIRVVTRRDMTMDTVA